MKSWLSDRTSAKNEYSLPKLHCCCLIIRERRRLASSTLVHTHKRKKHTISRCVRGTVAYSRRYNWTLIRDAKRGKIHKTKTCCADRGRCIFVYMRFYSVQHTRVINLFDALVAVSFLSLSLQSISFLLRNGNQKVNVIATLVRTVRSLLFTTGLTYVVTRWWDEKTQRERERERQTDRQKKKKRNAAIHVRVRSRHIQVTGDSTLPHRVPLPRASQLGR